jgi:toxin secretion/phage lysis holin
MKLKYAINTIFALISTNLVILLGGYDKLLSTLVLLVIIDYITGVAKGYKSKSLNSYIGFKGIAKKVCLFLLVAVGHKLDTLGMMGDPILRTVIIMFYISNEGISLIENMSELGVPIPDEIKNRLLKK